MKMKKMLVQLKKRKIIRKRTSKITKKAKISTQFTIKKKLKKLKLHQ